MSTLVKLILLLCVRFKLSDQSAIIAEDTTNTTTTEFSFEPYRQCFSDGDIIDCLHTEIVSSLDKALVDNDTWHLGEYVTLQRNPEFGVAERSLGRGADDGVMAKFYDVLRSRKLQLQSDLMPSEEGKPFLFLLYFTEKTCWFHIIMYTRNKTSTTQPTRVEFPLTKPFEVYVIAIAFPRRSNCHNLFTCLS